MYRHFGLSNQCGVFLECILDKVSNRQEKEVSQCFYWCKYD